jgi:hypothetical protein
MVKAVMPSEYSAFFGLDHKSGMMRAASIKILAYCRSILSRTHSKVKIISFTQA